jgi:hypothetical protein
MIAFENDDRAMMNTSSSSSSANGLKVIARSRNRPWDKPEESPVCKIGDEEVGSEAEPVRPYNYAYGYSVSWHILGDSRFIVLTTLIQFAAGQTMESIERCQLVSIIPTASIKGIGSSSPFFKIKM